MSAIERLLKSVLLASRWIQAPLYFGLTLAAAALGVKFFLEIIHTLPQVLELEERRLVLFALASIDLVLVVNLLVMVIVWGYSKFVSPLGSDDEDDHQLSWVTRLSAGTLRVEVAASLVSISAVRLLEAFLDIDQISADKLMWLVVIHVGFAISAIMLAWLDKLEAARHPHG